jgi:hypothetical protein
MRTFVPARRVLCLVAADIAGPSKVPDEAGTLGIRVDDVNMSRRKSSDRQ